MVGLHRELVGANGAPSTTEQRALPILWKRPFDMGSSADRTRGGYRRQDDSETLILTRLITVYRDREPVSTRGDPGSRAGLPGASAPHRVD